MSNFYLDYIKKEIERLERDKYTGKIDYQFNFFKGGIASINKNTGEVIKEAEVKK